MEKIGEKERKKRDREERENTEQKLQVPGGATKRILEPAAVPGASRVGVGNPATCYRSAVER